MNILDAYVKKVPSKQNILDIFDGEWSSKFPVDSGFLTSPGFASLFEDGRIHWAEDTFGSFRGWSVLELGPLEGAHSFMLQDKGCARVVAVEANSRAFLKCLCVKEVLGLDRVDFQLGDFMSFLRKEEGQYDLIVASGVLYHMEDPIELIKLISKSSHRALLWTHYFDEKIIRSRDDLSFKFSTVSSFEYDGVTYEQSVQSYKNSLDWAGFNGGPAPVSKWLTRDSIFRALKNYGFNSIEVGFEQIDHQNGPAFALCVGKQL